MYNLQCVSNIAYAAKCSNSAQQSVYSRLIRDTSVTALLLLQWELQSYNAVLVCTQYMYIDTEAFEVGD
jgi:hypothetical protein